jgi:DnaJ-class molecular chaperone
MRTTAEQELYDYVVANLRITTEERISICSNCSGLGYTKHEARYTNVVSYLTCDLCKGFGRLHVTEISANLPNLSRRLNNRPATVDDINNLLNTKG